MFKAIIDWDGKQNVVVITDGQSTMRIPLDDFIALPAVRYVMELAVEERSRKSNHQIDHPQERRP